MMFLNLNPPIGNPDMILTKVKKYVALALSIIILVICGWLIAEQFQYLDIASNKTDLYVMQAKRNINNRTDLDDCEKQLQIIQLEHQREQ